MKESILRDKSKAFAIRIIKLYKFLLEEKKEFVISKQILRCGTSIGANFAEAIYGVSEADFMNKLSIAQKEASETIYWLELLYRTKYIDEPSFKSLSSKCSSLRVMLISSCKTAKQNLDK